jgi:hypothetical protein
MRSAIASPKGLGDPRRRNRFPYRVVDPGTVGWVVDGRAGRGGEHHLRCHSGRLQ